MALHKQLREREVTYEQPTTAWQKNPPAECIALPEVLEEVAVGNPLVESSDSYLAGLIHDSCSQAEDSKSRVVVMTPSSQRSPTPRISTPSSTRAALGSPAPQASQSAPGSPIPCPASVSPSLSSFSPASSPRKQHPQDQVLTQTATPEATPETLGLGYHIPGTQPRPIPVLLPSHPLLSPLSIPFSHAQT